MAPASARVSDRAPLRSLRGRSRGPDISHWKVERERAAFPGLAPQLDFAAEQVREFAADREPEPRAPVTAIGAGVRLLKGLEYDALLLRRNADAGVGHLERDDADAVASTG